MGDLRAVRECSFMNAKHGKEKSRAGKVLTAALSVAAVLLFAACVLSWLVLNDPQAGKVLPAQPSDAVAKTVLKSVVTGQECGFTPDEMSGYLQYLIVKEDGAADGGGIEAAVLTAGSENTADLYLPVRYRGKSFGITVNVTPSCDAEEDRMVFRVNSLKIGRLPVDPVWALSLVKDRLPAGLTVQENAVSREASLLSLSAGDSSADLKVTQLGMRGGLVRLKVSGKVNLSFLGNFT